MFGLGTQELLLILLIVVVLFGAAKIPELARSLGKGVSEFRKAQKEGREDTKGNSSVQPAGGIPRTAAAMTACPACQNEITSGTLFCPKCGGRLRATKTCRACRNQAGSDDTLCPKGGEKL